MMDFTSCEKVEIVIFYFFWFYIQYLKSLFSQLYMLVQCISAESSLHIVFSLTLLFAIIIAIAFHNNDVAARLPLNNTTSILKNNVLIESICSKFILLEMSASILY